MSRRTFSILGAAGFLAVTVSAVYLLITPSSLRHQITPNASEGGQFQPVGTSERPIQTGPGEGELAPNFSAPRFSGGALSLIGLRGEGGVRNFFCSWGTPCRLGGPYLETTDPGNQAQGLVFLAVDNPQEH